MSKTLPHSPRDWNLQRIRMEFPILQRKVDRKFLCYLDNAASFPKLKTALDTVYQFSATSYANVHRSVHRLSQESTEAYEGVRASIARDIGAESSTEVIFTRGTTSSLNIVAKGYCPLLKAGDEIILTRLEHHANFVPWQQMAKQYGLQLKIVELKRGEIHAADIKALITSKTKIIAVSGISNVLGTIQPVNEISALAKKAGAIFVLDAAQVVAHGVLRLSEWGNPDFVAFSGHKMGSPNGIGILYGRGKHLERLAPFEFGGDMIAEVKDLDSKWNDLPWRLEAGTPSIDAVIGLGATWSWFQNLNWTAMADQERLLTEKVSEGLQSIPGLRLFGPSNPQKRVPTFSFELEGIHAHDLGTFLDGLGICVRAGHHCCQPLHRALKVASSTRASFAFFNTLDEADRFLEGVREARDYFVKRGICRK